MNCLIFIHTESVLQQAPQLEVYSKDVCAQNDCHVLSPYTQTHVCTPAHPAYHCSCALSLHTDTCMHSRPPRLPLFMCSLPTHRHMYALPPTPPTTVHVLSPYTQTHVCTPAHPAYCSCALSLHTDTCMHSRPPRLPLFMCSLPTHRHMYALPPTPPTTVHVLSPYTQTHVCTPAHPAYHCCLIIPVHKTQNLVHRDYSKRTQTHRHPHTHKHTDYRYKA